MRLLVHYRDHFPRNFASWCLIVPRYISICIWVLKIVLGWKICKVLPLHLLLNISCFVIIISVFIMGSFLAFPIKTDFLSRYMVEVKLLTIQVCISCHRSFTLLHSYNKWEMVFVLHEVQRLLFLKLNWCSFLFVISVLWTTWKWEKRVCASILHLGGSVYLNFQFSGWLLSSSSSHFVLRIGTVELLCNIQTCLIA